MMFHAARTRHSLTSLLIIATLALAAACGSDEPMDDDDMQQGMTDEDMDTTEDMEPADEDMAPDMSDTDPVDMDMAPVACQAFPAPVFGAGAGGSQLGMNPERCGQMPYQWNDSATLGDIVSTREETTFQARILRVALQTTGVSLPREPQYDVVGQQVEYITQDRGQLIGATTYIAAPKVEGNESFDTLLLLHGTAGFTDMCAPSNDEEARLLAVAIASLGYIVVGPDYVGLKGTGEPTGFTHPYLVGESVAMSSLDAARAAGKLTQEQLGGACASPRLLLLGGSQGGHAALWVDRLAPYYAAEFEMLGGVATVPPADLLGQLVRALTSVVQASGNTLAFYGASAHWYGLEERLSEVFISPYDVDVPAALAADCDPEDALGVDLDSITSLSEVFQQSFIDSRMELDMDPGFGCMAVTNGLTTTDIMRLDDSSSYASNYGLLWVLGEDDQLVNSPIERDSFDTLCGEGMPMEFLECAGASHTAATLWALPEILTFIDARQKGEPLGATMCQRSAPVRCEGTPDE